MEKKPYTMKSFNIGSGKLTTPCILAPLSGISDLPFRMVNRSFGCKYAFTEMLSARSLICKSPKTNKILASVPEDRPLGVQLLGRDPEDLRRALDVLQRHYTFDSLDLNAACPAKKVTRRGEGAALMKEPPKLQELLRTLVTHTDMPVTVKIRAGWDKNSINARDIALCAQDAGIHAIFIHGRTRSQKYNGSVDYRIIRDTKAAVDIPVIGSGDILSPFHVKRMLDATGCDGVAVARGSFGNPWLFEQTAYFLTNSRMPLRPSQDEIINTMVMHLNLCCDFYGEHRGTVLFRKFFSWYTKGFPHIRPQRTRAFGAEQKDHMLSIIEELRFAATGSKLNPLEIYGLQRNLYQEEF